MREVGTLHSGTSEDLLIALQDRRVEIGDLLYVRVSESSWQILQTMARTVMNMNKETALYTYSRIGRVSESSIIGSPHIDVANAKPLFQVWESGGYVRVTLPTQIPPGGERVYILEDEDEELAKLSEGISKPGAEGFFGYLRSGRRFFKSAPLRIPWSQAIPHQVLVTGMTGSGKSNFVKDLITWYATRRLEEHDCRIGFLVLDHHSEYHGERLEREGLGLLPRIARANGHTFRVYLPMYYYERITSSAQLDPLLYSPLKLPVSVLDPEHVALFADFTEAQADILHVVHTIAQGEGTSWVRMFIEEPPRNIVSRIRRYGLGVRDVTVETLRRRLIRILGFRVSSGGVIDDSRSLFSIKDEDSCMSIFEEIVEAIEKGGIIVLDLSVVPEIQSTLASAAIIERIFENRMGGGASDSIVAVVSEEAPKYLNPKMARSPANIFAKVAREGRKFNIGLIAITQSCSLIERQIIANMNTIIAFRTSYRGDLDLLSQAGVESGELPYLMKGEAVVHSTFLNISVPIPVKFPRASDYLSEGAPHTFRAGEAEEEEEGII